MNKAISPKAKNEVAGSLKDQEIATGWQKRLQPLLRKVCSSIDGAEVTCSGKLFQVREAATGNARSPTVDIAALAVRSVQTLTTISVFALNWCRLHVEVRHRDIPAPGYVRLRRPNAVALATIV